MNNVIIFWSPFFSLWLAQQMQLCWYFWLMSLIWQDTFGPAGPALKVIWMHFPLHFPVKDCFCSLKFCFSSDWICSKDFFLNQLNSLYEILVALMKLDIFLTNSLNPNPRKLSNTLKEFVGFCWRFIWVYFTIL